VFAAANFGVSGNQAVTLPSGTWFDYLGGASRANGTYTLAPGELKVFTSTAVQAPVFADIETRDHTDVPMVQDEAVKAYKILRDGQVLILRGGRVYNMQGQLVK